MSDEPLKCKECGDEIELYFEKLSVSAIAVLNKYFMELLPMPLDPVCDGCLAKNQFKYPEIGSMN